MRFFRFIASRANDARTSRICDRNNYGTPSRRANCVRWEHTEGRTLIFHVIHAKVDADFFEYNVYFMIASIGFINETVSRSMWSKTYILPNKISSFALYVWCIYKFAFPFIHIHSLLSCSILRCGLSSCIFKMYDQIHKNDRYNSAIY